MRLLNVLLVAPLPLLLYQVAWRLSQSRQVGAAAALLALAVPMLHHLGAAVSPVGPLLPAGAIVSLCALLVLRGDRTFATGVWLGGALGAALLVEFLAIALAAAALGALLVAGRRDGWSSLVPVAVGATAASAVGWAWWAFAVVGRGSRPLWTAAAFDPADSRSDWLLEFPVRFAHTAWGELGFAGAPLGLPWAMGASLVVLIGVAVGVLGVRRDQRPERLVLLAPAAALLALLIVSTLASASGALPMLSGFQAFPALPGLLALAATGLATLAGRRRWALLPLILLGAAGMQALAVRLILDMQWGGASDGVVRSLQALVTWSPWSGRTVVALGALAVTSGAVLVAAVSRDAARSWSPEGWGRRSVVAANAGVIAACAAAVVLAARAGVPAHELFRDANADLVLPLHAGLMSHLGVVGWAIGGGASLFAAAALRSRPGRRRHARLFAGVGSLTVVFAADDLIMFHEGAGIGPNWLGIPEMAIIGSYALAGAVLAAVYRDLLVTLPTRGVLLAAIFFFALSTAIDVVDHHLTYVVAEDVAKTIGIVNWALGWSLAGVALLRESWVDGATRPAAREADPTTP